MTNPSPEQLLSLAKICEPDKEWKVIAKGFEVAWFTGREFVHYEPFRGTVRGKAQLMQVVFTFFAANPSRKQLLMFELSMVARDVDAIIRLAIEVLL